MLGFLFLNDSPFEPSSIIALFLRAPLKCAVYFLYRFLTSLRSAPIPANPPIRIVCISDTHTLSQPIPDGDVLIHAGDLTNAGDLSELQAQIDWLNSLSHPHKIAIAGNHDTYLDPRSRRTLSEAQRNGTLQWGNIHYLQHSSITLMVANPTGPSKYRTLKVYGAPQVPDCGGPEHAFQYPRGRDAWTDTIPKSIDILVTHTPPKYQLDLPLPTGLGDEYLMRELWRVRPRLHVFGHVHVGAGKQVNWWDDSQAAYERALSRPVGRLTRGLLDVGMWVDLATVLFYGVRNVIWDRVWGGEARGTFMVNAGLMMGNSGRLGNTVQVVQV